MIVNPIVDVSALSGEIGAANSGRMEETERVLEANHLHRFSGCLTCLISCLIFEFFGDSEPASER